MGFGSSQRVPIIADYCIRLCRSGPDVAVLWQLCAVPESQVDCRRRSLARRSDDKSICCRWKESRSERPYPVSDFERACRSFGPVADQYPTIVRSPQILDWQPQRLALVRCKPTGVPKARGHLPIVRCMEEWSCLRSAEQLQYCVDKPRRGCHPCQLPIQVQDLRKRYARLGR